MFGGTGFAALSMLAVSNSCRSGSKTLLKKQNRCSPLAPCSQRVPDWDPGQALMGKKHQALNAWTLSGSHEGPQHVLP